MEFIKDENFLVKHKDKDIFLMVSHKWAFVVWEIERMRGNIKEGSTLFHVDTHLDDVPELIESNKIYELSNEDDVIQFAKYEGDLELRIDNFIFPSFVRDTINHIYYVSNTENESEFNQNHIDMNAITMAGEGENIYLDRNDTTSDYTLIKLYEILKGKDKNIQRLKGVEELDIIDLKKLKGDKILDLDLDYFNNSTLWKTAELKNEEVIISNLKKLKGFTEWDLITVALSPSFCGEDDDCLNLLNLFLDIFEVSISDFEYYL